MKKIISVLAIFLTFAVKAQTGQSEKTKVVDNFPKATCKVYKEGILVGIVEAMKMYKIESDGTKSHEAAIQNKNEYCKNSYCIRLAIQKNGIILGYELPKTTQGSPAGKIEGDKIFRCKDKDCNETINSNFTFKGSVIEAALLVNRYAFFR